MVRLPNTNKSTAAPKKGPCMKRQLKVILIALEVSILSICMPSMYPKISEALEKRAETISPNPKIIKGIHLLYDGKFDTAENIFYRVVAGKPEDPAGYFYLAMVTWSKLASGFWSPEMVQQYGERIDKAIWIAKKKIEDGKSDSFTYFYLGGALGFKGRFHLMEQRWLSSFYLAIEAIRALETCREMDPSNKDVLLGLGIFDYYTARLSGVLKFLSYLLVHKGDKEEGLRKLHIAAEEAIYSSVEAKSLLLHIYLFLEEEYFQKALILANELAERFSGSPRNIYLKGVAYIRLDMDHKYREVVDCLRQTACTANSKEDAISWEKQALYLEASHDLFHAQLEKARSKLDAILSHLDPEYDPLMIAWPLLKKGMSYDLEGNREEASSYYKKILAMKNGAGAQFLAQKYLDEPPQKGDPFLGY